MANTLDTFNKSINKYVAQTSLQEISFQILAEWRDIPEPETGSAWGRRFIIIVPLALAGIIGLVDSIASLFFSLFVLPVECFGYHLAKALWERFLIGAIYTTYSLTLFQYNNIVNESLKNASGKRTIQIEKPKREPKENPIMENIFQEIENMQFEQELKVNVGCWG